MNSSTAKPGNIRAKIERSSLGTKDARAARSTVSDATARHILSRAAALPQPVSRKKVGG